MRHIGPILSDGTGGWQPAVNSSITCNAFVSIPDAAFGRRAQRCFWTKVAQLRFQNVLAPERHGEKFEHFDKNSVP